jgi:ribosomal protein S18 acetylase RimI-like enzyme
MPAAIVRILEAGEWRVYQALRLQALKDAPDAFGATLAEAEARPEAAWRERLLNVVPARDLPLLAEVGIAPCGLAWGHIDAATPAVAHVFQMWVSPARRGQGVARQLLTRVVEWSRSCAVQSVVLSVTSGNSPARNLYESAGFVAVGDPEPLRPGSALTAQAMALSLDGSSLP